MTSRNMFISRDVGLKEIVFPFQSPSSPFTLPPITYGDPFIATDADKCIFSQAMPSSPSEPTLDVCHISSLHLDVIAISIDIAGFSTIWPINESVKV